MERALSSSAQTAACQVPEAITDVRSGYENYEEYNRLLCLGIDQMKTSTPERAVELLERAFPIRFHEDVNYALFPRLALAYHFAGDHEKARLTLGKAEVAMKPHVGLFRCSTDSQGVYVVADGRGVPVASPYKDEVADRMYTVFSEGDYYVPRSLEEYVQKAELVYLYLDAKRAIEP